MALKPLDLLGIAQQAIRSDGITDVADEQTNDLWGEATSDAKGQKGFILGDKQKRILSRMKSQGFISGTTKRK